MELKKGQEIEGFSDYIIYPDKTVWSKKNQIFIKPYCCKYSKKYFIQLFNDKNRRVVNLDDVYQSMFEYDLKDGGEIKNYPRYLIFENGDIYNKYRMRYMKQTKTPEGYFTIQLTNEENKQSVLVHRLIAECFIPNPDNKPFVDHINRKRDDNRVNNLRWVSQSENSRNTSKCRNLLLYRGVSFKKEGRYNAFRVIYVDNNGKQKSKSFNIRKHGYIEALKKAVIHRYEMEKENEYITLQTPSEYFKSNGFLNMLYEWN
jgi:hypothetical protein